MNDIKLNTNTRIEVLWLDTVEEPEWKENAHATDPPIDAMCKTIGYYTGRDKNFLYVSGTISNTARNQTSIPLGMIQMVRSLRTGKVHANE